jgi:hypothetical protein
MILLIGSEGGMGRRYKAIFDLIQKEYVPNDGYHFDGYLCYDTKLNQGKPQDQVVDLHELAKKASGFLIATPTETHAEVLSSIYEYGKPILCEKPVTKNLALLDVILKRSKETGCKFQMVNQYAYAYVETTGLQKKQITEVSPLGDGYTMYNYFRHGTDGLAWDCINILGLSKKNIFLNETSPIWQCQINGHPLSLSDIDSSYVRMILDWLRDPKDDTDYIRKAHAIADATHKVFQHEHDASFNSDTVQKHLY